MTREGGAAGSPHARRLIEHAGAWLGGARGTLRPSRVDASVAGAFGTNLIEHLGLHVDPLVGPRVARLDPEPKAFLLVQVEPGGRHVEEVLAEQPGLHLDLHGLRAQRGPDGTSRWPGVGVGHSSP